MSQRTSRPPPPPRQAGGVLGKQLEYSCCGIYPLAVKALRMRRFTAAIFAFLLLASAVNTRGAVPAPPHPLAGQPFAPVSASEPVSQGPLHVQASPMPPSSAVSKRENPAPLEAPEEPLLLPRHLAMTVTCSNVIPKTSLTITLYGDVLATGAPSYYCTSATGSTYSDDAFQASLHTAPPGYRIVLAITQWNTEEGYDYGALFLTARGSTPTVRDQYCSLSGVSAGVNLYSGGTTGAYAGFPPGLTSAFGGGIGLCFFSDDSVV